MKRLLKKESTKFCDDYNIQTGEVCNSLLDENGHCLNPNCFNYLAPEKNKQKAHEGYKICPRCNNEFPKTDDYFYKNKQREHNQNKNKNRFVSYEPNRNKWQINK